MILRRRVSGFMGQRHPKGVFEYMGVPPEGAIVTLLNPDKGHLTVKGISGQGGKPRICLLTGRNFNRRVFQCGLYECEDVLMEIDDVDLIHLEPGVAFQLREKWQRKLVWHDITKRLVFINPGFHPIRPEREYDLFVVVCNTLVDLLYVSAVKGWKDYCKKSICWITELWASDLPESKSWLSALRKFDHVVVTLNGSVKAVSDAIGRPCHCVPSGVDAIRFSPYPEPPDRVIDVLSIGRRWEGVHHALRNLASREDMFYIYDTFDVTDAQIQNHRQHRELFANMAKRSRFFVVWPAKMNAPEETHGQVEVGYRYYEGSATGTVMIGQTPDCEAFHTMFGWPDAVIDIRPDGSDVAEVLSRFASHPEQLLEVSRRNAMEALLRHDWAYRWKQILEIAGLKPAPALASRERRLTQLAEQAKGNG